MDFGRTERGFPTLLPVLETLNLLSKHSLELSLRLLLLALLLALILPAHAAVASQPTCGIILMHGKWGMPQSPYLKPVVEKLSPDCRVVLLEMPWSRKRLYDKPYRDALQQIKAAVDSLRQSGAQWIAVGGQSFGANAALAYMAQVGDVDAIIPLAPGHVPETFYQDSDISRVVDESSRLVQSGKGDTLLELNDMNQGRRRSLKLTAEALWSYFNPQGLGNMSLSAQHSKKAVPVFWAIGNLDPLYGSVSEEIYRRLPADPGSVYLEVRADHATTPEAATEALGKWVAARKVR